MYAALISLGRSGFTSLFARNVAFATLVASFLRSHPCFDVLTPAPGTSAHEQMNIVLFAPSAEAPSRFQGEGGAGKLLKEINAGREVYGTPTKWRGREAIRIAVSNWRTEPSEGGRDFTVLKRVLDDAIKE